MPKTGMPHPSHKSLKLLSCLVLPAHNQRRPSTAALEDFKQELLNLSRHEFDDLVELAGSNHVIVRGLEAFLDIISETEDTTRIEWARTALQTERDRIA